MNVLKNRSWNGKAKQKCNGAESFASRVAKNQWSKKLMVVLIHQRRKLKTLLDIQLRKEKAWSTVFDKTNFNLYPEVLKLRHRWLSIQQPISGHWFKKEIICTFSVRYYHTHSQTSSNLLFLLLPNSWPTVKIFQMPRSTEVFIT